jgi:hypothetical protein
MLGSRGRPPASFPVWLTRPGDSLVFLGRAEPPAAGDEPAGRRSDVPRYRLAFAVPEVPPGLYKYVLFCDACAEGPHGGLIDSPAVEAGRLRVLPPVATVGGGGGGGALPWLAAGGLAAALILGARPWAARP